MFEVTLPEAKFKILRRMTDQVLADYYELERIAHELPDLTAGSNADFMGNLTLTHLNAEFQWPRRSAEGLAAVMEAAIDLGTDKTGRYTFMNEDSPRNVVGQESIHLRYASDPAMPLGRGRVPITKVIAYNWDAGLARLRLTDEQRAKFDLWRTKFMTALETLHHDATLLNESDIVDSMYEPARAYEKAARKRSSSRRRA